VFDLFTQLENSIDRSQGGLGIGLTLVRELVELHGGRVEVASAGPNQGCEFSVRIPKPSRKLPKSELHNADETSSLDRAEPGPEIRGCSPAA